MFKGTVVFSCLLVLISVSVAFGQTAKASDIVRNIPAYEPSTSAASGEMKMTEEEIFELRRRVVTVPSSQYPIIQDALNARECNIRILPGYYRVNLQVLPNINCVTSISADNPNSVLLDGGNTGNTISLWIEAEVSLKKLNIVNDQQFGNYDVAAIQGWGGVGFTIDNCVIVSRSVGLGTSYASYATVTNSTIVGTAANSIGVSTYLNNVLGRNTGVRLYNNRFESLHIGTFNYELQDPGVQTISFCRRGPRCSDSNTYQGVELIFVYENGNNSQ